MASNAPALNVDRLIELRRELHRHPEVSNEEEKTSDRIAAFLEEHSPARIVRGLGGTGLAAVWEGKDSGPTVMIRSELDALPIRERNQDLEYGSEVDGVGHKCGHDGHMAMVAGLAPIFAGSPPERGRLVLLYQPAEETGEGARRVLDDPKFEEVRPDYAYALHNLPGFPEGQIIMRSGVFASASRGLDISLQGSTTHASLPKDGRNPSLCLAQITEALLALPNMYTDLHQGAMVTPIYLRVGRRAFGTSAGRGSAGFTIRTHSDKAMDALCDRAVKIVEGLAAVHEIDVETSWLERFEAVKNADDCMEFLGNVAADLDLSTRTVSEPFPWSEDFGVFTSKIHGAMFGLGAGKDHPQLHNGHYDFPDGILETGTRMFHGIVRSILGGG
jgi:amidohydrolase